jgi:DNA-binding transcriptional LysR family regulator
MPAAYGIQAVNLAGADLNLLVTFDALLAERSVTRAAERVGLSQSAMSNALRRLRTWLDDPVLVRTSDGMAPTKRALELVDPIHEALSQLDRALATRNGFDPRTSRQTFRIATADVVEFMLVPRLLERLAGEAPGIDVEMVQLRGGLPAEDLRAGRLDLAIGTYGDAPEPFRTQPMFHETFVCAVRKGHPRVRGKLTLKQFVELGHVLTTPHGRPGGVVDRLLAERGLSRRVAVTTPHFLVAPILVAHSDLVGTLPSRVAHALAAFLPLTLHRPPLDVPGFSVAMVWHTRTAEEPPHRWLRQVLGELAASF